MSITPQGISILELYRLYRGNNLIVNRRYQRKLVWTKSEKASLIESILLKYPIPLILFGKFKKEGKDMYEIMDGMQRLNAIFGFVENQFSTKNGIFFDVVKHPLANELSNQGVFKPIETDAENLLNAQECVDFLEYSLAVTIYEPESDKEIEDIFNRINSNGKHLSAQEVRQAGVTSKFAGLVRSLASEIRGDVSREILPLTEMPEISIDYKSIDLGYGVLAEDTFWCSQGIIRNSDLRDSTDEQLLADIILSIALQKPFPATKENFDSYYGKGDTDKSDEIELAVTKYGVENLKEDVKAVLSNIKNSLNFLALPDLGNHKNFLRKVLSRDGGVSNPVKEPFYTLFMAFYELMIKESKEPFDCQNIFDAAMGLMKKIEVSSTITTDKRIKNIALTKGLIQNYFKPSESTTRSSGSYAIDLENYLRRSKTEAPNYDFKQGLFFLNPTNRNFDSNCFEKICQNIAAMANLGKGRKGYIFLGISDTEKDTKHIEKLDQISAPMFFSFGIVGLEREAKIQGITLDQYILNISRKIRNSKLPEWLKTSVNTALTPITYHDHTVLMIEIQSGKEPVWYDNKLYIRDGHEKKPQELSGEKVSAVYSLFQ
jgi:dimeric dUTPase (all-alpha-NTP-PPase superfamily)